jgi:hypothetical protein
MDTHLFLFRKCRKCGENVDTHIFLFLSPFPLGKRGLISALFRRGCRISPRSLKSLQVSPRDVGVQISPNLLPDFPQISVGVRISPPDFGGCPDFLSRFSRRCSVVRNWLTHGGIYYYMDGAGLSPIFSGQDADGSLALAKPGKSDY